MTLSDRVLQSPLEQFVGRSLGRCAGGAARGCRMPSTKREAGCCSDQNTDRNTAKKARLRRFQSGQDSSGSRAPDPVWYSQVEHLSMFCSCPTLRRLTRMAVDESLRKRKPQGGRLLRLQHGYHQRLFDSSALRIRSKWHS